MSPFVFANPHQALPAVAAVLMLGCSNAPPQRDAASPRLRGTAGAPTASDAAAPGALTTASPTRQPTTRYRVGDYVVYRYSGGALPAALTLREQVRAQEGNRLRIDVTLSGGPTDQRWVQVLTDTPENQANNVIDALYEWQGQSLVKLANQQNADAFRLYQPTLFMPDGAAKDASEAACEQTVAGQQHACTCRRGSNRWQAKPVTFVEAVCPGFLWTNAAGTFVDASGAVVYKMEVVETGRDGSLPRAPLVPVP